MIVEWALGVCAPVALALVSVVLVAEAGLLVGLVLPAGSLVLGLGVLAGAGAVPVPLAALSVAVATVLGAVLGHQLARRRAGGRAGAATRAPVAWPPVVVGRLVDRVSAPLREVVGRRPVWAAAGAQFVAGPRTLAPRLAASAGVPVATMLRGTAPAAVVWSGGLVTGGAVAGAALPLEGLLAGAGVLVALVVGGRLLLRRRRAGQPVRQSVLA